jgi:hypothetical protein
VAGLLAQAAEGKKEWEKVSGDGYAIAVPAGWRTFDMGGPMMLFRQGDGIGVPVVDETGAPIQIGLTVEKFVRTTDTLEEGAKKMARNAKNNPRLKLVGEEKTEPLKLADGTDAMLVTTRFIKEQTRGSLQMKMVVKDQASNGWVVSGFLVSGKDSKVPVEGSPLAMWLRAHVVSFCFDGAKVDEGAMKRAYEERHSTVGANKK